MVGDDNDLPERVDCLVFSSFALYCEEREIKTQTTKPIFFTVRRLTLLQNGFVATL